MKTYIFKRVVLLFGTLLGVMAITFVLTRVLPSSPEHMMFGHRPTHEQVEAARKQLGLDKPIYEQFVIYVGNVARGDFGMSLQTRQPVLDDVLGRLMATLELTNLSVILVLLIGLPMGVISAVHQNKPADHVARTFSIAGCALPSFMLGMVLQMCFYGWLGWLPLQGRINSEVFLNFPFEKVTGFFLIDTLLSGQWPAFLSAVQHLILPTATLTIVTVAVVSRMTRNTMIEALSEDFTQTAFAYGHPKRDIYYRYTLKATMIPLLTVAGLTYGWLLGGAVVVEFVFDWPGLGGYTVNAITRGDFPAVMGVTMFLAGTYLTITLIVDLLYYVVDPRLKVR